MRPLVVAALVPMVACSVLAAEISTLATLAAEAPLQELANSFRQQTGHLVMLQTDTSPNITKRLASGERPDVLIALASTVDQAITEGKAIAATRASIGRIGVGVAISRGGRRPDISTVDALRASVLQADAVLYSRGASGLYVEQMLKAIGVADQIKAKTTQLATGGAVMERLGNARGQEIGFTMVSEIRQGESHGGSLIGPLPSAIQSYTPYEAVVMTTTASPETAHAFIRAITGPGARKLLAASGWEF